MNRGDYFHLATEHGRRYTYKVEAIGSDEHGQVWVVFRWIELDGRDGRRKVTMAEFEALLPYCPLEYAVSYRAAHTASLRSR